MADFSNPNGGNNMALINCPECNKEISDKANSCPNCGFPISEYIKDQKDDSNISDDESPDTEFCNSFETRSTDEGVENTDVVTNKPLAKQVVCQFCGMLNEDGSMYCAYCGQLIDLAEIQRRIQLENLRLQKQQLEVQQRQLNEQKQIRTQQANEYNNMAKCPRCGSTSLSGNKKGFGIGKAVIGAAVIGPIGLMAGNIGAKKVKVTCLKCGKTFWA